MKTSNKELGERSLQELILDLKEQALTYHHYCEDSWYSCPKAPEGCADKSQGEECNCEADNVNRLVEELYKLIVEKLRGEAT